MAFNKIPVAKTAQAVFDFSSCFIFFRYFFRWWLYFPSLKILFILFIPRYRTEIGGNSVREWRGKLIFQLPLAMARRTMFADWLAKIFIFAAVRAFLVGNHRVLVAHPELIKRNACFLGQECHGFFCPRNKMVVFAFQADFGVMGFQFILAVAA